MLKRIATCAALALAVIPPAAQASAQSGKVVVGSDQAKAKGAEVQGTSQATEMSKQNAEAAAQADQAVGELEQLAAEGQVGGPKMKRLEQALAKDPSLEPNRKRLEAYVASLRERSEKGDVTAADVQRIHTGMVDARFESAFRELRAKVEKRGATEADFDQLAKLLVERSAAAKGLALDLGKHQKRLEQAIGAMKQRYLSDELKADELDLLHEQVAVARVDAELGDLEQQVTAGRATRSDFDGARMQIQRRAAAMSKGGAADKDLEQRMTQALDKIEQQAEAGETVPAEEFTALRKGLTQRPREAGAPR